MCSKCLAHCCASLKYGSDESEEYARSRMIDKELLKAKRTLKREVKLLLLGAGESGKSTFLKQMKIIHGQLDPSLYDEFKEVIRQNVIKGMKVLIDARDKLAIPWGEEHNSVYADHVFAANIVRCSPEDFSVYCSSIHALWQDKGIRTAFERRNEFQISDGVRYLLDSVARISARDYIPTQLDILHARKATKGISEYSVTINNVPFRFVDVGGQRSQRPKWFQCFESVTSILFLVSSSEYDQVLLEDRTTNRLEESLNIFETIANNRCFTEVSMILFLNKTDVLEEKLQRARQLFGYDEKTPSILNSPVSDKKETSIKDGNHEVDALNGTPRVVIELEDVAKSPTISLSEKSSSFDSDVASMRISLISEYFPDFQGDPFLVEDVQQYLVKLFDSARKDRKKPMYHHCTTAVDTNNIKYVFNAVRNTILQKNITSLMLQ
ncbi:Guanine nucleotide-binding protein subunit alpha-13 [Halotydeus destructor]|nr:Guanine nucleotide-binding protein subunit alpha-13 [Halotydeus destructor]